MSALRTDPPFWARRPGGRVAHWMIWRPGDGDYRRPVCGELTPERADLLHPAADDDAHCRMCTRKADAVRGRCASCGCSNDVFRVGCMCSGGQDDTGSWDCGCADGTLQAIADGDLVVIDAEEADTLRRMLAYAAACRAV